MSGELPEVYWWLFWVGVLAFVVVFAFTGMTLVHRRNMKALELLKLYADKGLSPPAALAELLAASRRETNGRGKPAPRCAPSGARLSNNR